MKTCTFDGCTRAAISKGLCDGHRQQLRRTGTLSPLRGSVERVCDFPDCGRPYRAAGLCPGHLWQRDSGRELTPLRQYRTAGPCNVTGCDLPGTLDHTPERQKTRVIDNGLQTMRPVTPLPAETSAKARDALIAAGGADLLDMLGLTA